MTPMMRTRVLHSQTFGMLNIQINLNCPGVEYMHLNCDKSNSDVCVPCVQAFVPFSRKKRSPMATDFAVAKAAIGSAYFEASSIRNTNRMTPIVDKSAFTKKWVLLC